MFARPAVHFRCCIVLGMASVSMTICSRQVRADVDAETEAFIAQGEFARAEERLKKEVGDGHAPVTSDAAVQAMRRFFELLAACPQVDATAIQIVGSKGYDGFAIALVTAASWPA